MSQTAYGSASDASTIDFVTLYAIKYRNFD